MVTIEVPESIIKIVQETTTKELGSIDKAIQKMSEELEKEGFINYIDLDITIARLASLRDPSRFLTAHHDKNLSEEFSDDVKRE